MLITSNKKLVQQAQEAIETLSEEEVQIIVEYARENDVSYWEAFEAIINIGASELQNGTVSLEDIV